MLKVFLVLVLMLGALLLITCIPHAWDTATIVGGHRFSYAFFGLCVVAYVAWKKIGS